MAGSDPRKSQAFGQGQDRVGDAEDPLVELARIVSEDGGFSGTRAEPARRSETSRYAAQPAAPQSVEGLEAELLQELETSFSARETPARDAAGRETSAREASSRDTSSRESGRSQRDPFARDAAGAGRDPLDDFLAEPSREAPLTFPARGSSVRASVPAEQEFERDADELLRSIEEQLGRF